MPKKPSLEYCSLTPDFPKEAYIVFLFILHDEKAVGMIPLDAIYTSIDDAAAGVEDVLRQLGETQHITVPEEALLMPITFQSLFPMRRSYWTPPTLAYDQQLRVKSFTNVAHYPSLHLLLVTPYIFDDTTESWFFSATLPILAGNEMKTIERFMYISDQVVEPRAKYSAIYAIGDKQQFNWKTKQTKKIDQAAIDELMGKMN